MPHVVALRDKFANTPAKANSLARQIRIIYGWGMPRGLVTHNPADFTGTSIKNLKIGTYHPWPEDLIERFLEKTEPEIAWVTMFCLYTGQRIGDVLNMSWSDIVDDKIRVIQEKTGKDLWIPLHPELK
ncbi:MAG: tyrosine-type recombinase/integrase, partial [Proteobacteria bacterium]|nr:tyrosine-type recombinase/integrase [Pseudomonadota bacterium]